MAIGEVVDVQARRSFADTSRWPNRKRIQLGPHRCPSWIRLLGQETVEAVPLGLRNLRGLELERLPLVGLVAAEQANEEQVSFSKGCAVHVPKAQNPLKVGPDADLFQALPHGTGRDVLALLHKTGNYFPGVLAL